MNDAMQHVTDGHRSHRETYPEQYSHQLCGKEVEIVTHAGPQTTGVVERVVKSRFGMIASLEGTDNEWWRVVDCRTENP